MINMAQAYLNFSIRFFLKNEMLVGFFQGCPNCTRSPAVASNILAVAFAPAFSAEVEPLKHAGSRF